MTLRLVLAPDLQQADRHVGERADDEEGAPAEAVAELAHGRGDEQLDLAMRMQ
jgi:hypothetical protein